MQILRFSYIFSQPMTMAFFGPFAALFCGLVSQLFGIARQVLGVGGTLGRGELCEGHIKGKVRALSLAGSPWRRML